MGQIYYYSDRMFMVLDEVVPENIQEGSRRRQPKKLHPIEEEYLEQVIEDGDDIEAALRSPTPGGSDSEPELVF